MPTSPRRDGHPAGGLARLLCLLWLAGVAMRMTLLVMPPVIPQVHDELRISETQVGLLIGLPLATLAVAAIPGSLLIARVGATLAVTLGMTIAALGGRRPRGRRRHLDAVRSSHRVGIWRCHHAAGHADPGTRMAPDPPCARNRWLFQRHEHGRNVPRRVHHCLHPAGGRG